MPSSRTRVRAGYDLSVFVNCPFDAAYAPLFQALIFTIEYCGFAARCAREISDSGQTRAEKLIDLIAGSRFGIHDLCRVEVSPGGLPRFNMPYELGLFVGFKYAGASAQRRKAILVLDAEPYRYQRALSDIAGQDIESHANDPGQLVRVVRNWLRSHAAQDLVGGAYVVDQYDRFRSQTPALLDRLGKTQKDLDNYSDFLALVHAWIGANPRPA